MKEDSGGRERSNVELKGKEEIEKLKTKTNHAANIWKYYCLPGTGEVLAE